MIEINIYWNDLSEEKQKEIQEALGMDRDDNGNWNMIPLATLNFEGDDTTSNE